MKNLFKDWSKLDISWLIIANLVIIAYSIYCGDALFSLIMAVCGITANLLVAKGSIVNYPFGIINVLMYAYIAYQGTLYGDFTLNLFFYFPMNCIGWFLWNKKKNNGVNQFKSLSKMAFIIVCAGSLLAIYIYGRILSGQGDVAPFTDATSTILSIVSMILMILYYKEQWIGWILVNIVSVYMWYLALDAGTGDFTTIAMWIVYLVNSIYGFVIWYKGAKGKEA